MFRMLVPYPSSLKFGVKGCSSCRLRCGVRSMVWVEGFRVSSLGLRALGPQDGILQLGADIPRRSDAAKSFQTGLGRVKKHSV